jgi:hypothetical protein
VFEGRPDGTMKVDYAFCYCITSIIQRYASSVFLENIYNYCVGGCLMVIADIHSLIRVSITIKKTAPNNNYYVGGCLMVIADIHSLIRVSITIKKTAPNNIYNYYVDGCLMVIADIHS